MSQLTKNTTDLDALIAKANALPDAGSGGGSVETCTVTIDAAQNGQTSPIIYYTQNNILKTEIVPENINGSIMEEVYTVDKNTIMYLTNLNLESGYMMYQSVTGGTLLSNSVGYAAWTCEDTNVSVSL